MNTFVHLVVTSQGIARKRREAVELELAAPIPVAEPPELVTARRTALETRRSARAAQIAMLEEEALSYGVRSQLYDVQRDLLNREISQAQRRVQILHEPMCRIRIDGTCQGQAVNLT